MEFVEFNEMTHSEILEVLLDHYNELREINSALVAITDLLDDLSIDVDEL